MNRFTFPLLVFILFSTTITNAQKKKQQKKETEIFLMSEETDDKEQNYDEIVVESTDYEEKGTFYNPKIITIEGKKYKAADLGKGNLLIFKKVYRYNVGIYADGKIYLPLIFDFPNGNYTNYNQHKIVLAIGYRQGLYDLISKKWLLPVQYENISILTPRYYKVKTYGKISIYDAQNEKFVRKNEWDRVKFDHRLRKHQLYIVNKRRNRHDYKGIYNANTNKMIAPVIYENIKYNYKNKIFTVIKNGKYNIMDLNGQLLYKNWYDQIIQLSKQRFIVKKDKDYQIFDLYEKPVTKQGYLSMKELGYLDKTYIIAQNKEGKYGYLDNYGKTLVPFVFDEVRISPYNSDYHIVSKNGKETVIKIIQKKMQQVLPEYFDKISVVKGYYLVKQNGLYGLYSIEGEEILKPEYQQISHLIRRYKNKRYFYAIKQNDSYIVNGKHVRKIPYKITDKLPDLSDPYRGMPKFMIVENSQHKQGLVNLDGKLIVPAKFDRINYQVKDVIVVEDKGKQGVFSIKENKFIIPVDYEQIILKDKNKLLLLSGSKVTEKIIR